MIHMKVTVKWNISLMIIQWNEDGRTPLLWMTGSYDLKEGKTNGDTLSYLVTHSLFHIRSKESKGRRKWNKNHLITRLRLQSWTSEKQAKCQMRKPFTKRVIYWSGNVRFNSPEQELLCSSITAPNKEIMVTLTLPRKDLLAGSGSSFPGLCSSDDWFRRLRLGFRATGGGGGLFPPAASLLMVLLECES